MRKIKFRLFNKKINKMLGWENVKRANLMALDDNLETG